MGRSKDTLTGGSPGDGESPREALLRGPVDRCRAALPMVLSQGARLSRDDALLARVDLLLFLHGEGVADADLGQYLTDNAGELLLLVLPD